jgi:hypothetical protein
VNSGDATIGIYDLQSASLVQNVQLPEGANPWDLVFVTPEDAFVTASAFDMIYRIDLTSGIIMDSLIVDTWPEGMKIDGRYLYVACSGFDSSTWTYGQSSVLRIDIDGWNVSDRVETPVNTQELAGFGRNLIALSTGDYLSVFGELTRIDLKRFEITGYLETGGSPGSIVITASGKGYLGDSGWMTSGIYSFDVIQWELLRGPDNPVTFNSSAGLLEDSKSSILYATMFQWAGGSLDLYDTFSDTLNFSMTTGNGPLALAYWGEKPDGEIFLNLSKVNVVPGDSVMMTVTVRNHGTSDSVFRIESSIALPGGKVLHPRSPISVNVRRSGEIVYSEIVTIPFAALPGDYIMTATLRSEGGSVVDESEVVITVDDASQS